MLTAAAMMGSMLKGDKDLVTLQIRSLGPLKGIVVSGDSHGRVKGYVFNPNVDIPSKYPGKLDVGGAIGEGYMSVIRDIGLKEPYLSLIHIFVACGTPEEVCAVPESYTGKYLKPILERK